MQYFPEVKQRPQERSSIRLCFRRTPPHQGVSEAGSARFDLSEWHQTTVASESTAQFQANISEHIHQLVLDSDDVEVFLRELAGMSARTLSAPGDKVLCGVTLWRHRKPVTVANSNAEAEEIGQVQYRFSDSPCMKASREQVTIELPDLEADTDWPVYTDMLMELGIRSLLAVPFKLEGDTRAALILYSGRADRFDGHTRAIAEDFVRQTSMALDLAVRLARYSEAAADLRATLETRTVIDMAVGIIMAQNRCTQIEAFNILKTASSTRNIKLREVARTVVLNLGQGPVKTYYDA